MKESDLYPALKTYLESLGYAVKGEIGDCDVVAVRGDEPPLIVELKQTLGLGVILQAVQRLALSDAVYVAVPCTCAPLRTHNRAVIRLLRMLGLGLITIDTRGACGALDVVLDPGPYQPRPSKAKRQRLLREFSERDGDPAHGGADRRRGIMTAYRQKALRICGHIDRNGPAKAALIARELQIPTAHAILYRNVYGWFERLSIGVYGLSAAGRTEPAQWAAAAAESPGIQPLPQTKPPRRPRRKKKPGKF